MKDTILKNWNWIRIVRLVLGVAILASGIVEVDYLAITVGVVFTALPIFNISTCAGGSCSSGNCGIDMSKYEKK